MHFSLAAERFLMTVTVTILIVHVTSCLLIFEAKFIEEHYGGESMTWMADGDVMDYSDFPGQRLYLVGIYYAFSISYGSIVAYNDFERIFGLIIMIGGGVLMGYSISVIG